MVNVSARGRAGQSPAGPVPGGDNNRARDAAPRAAAVGPSTSSAITHGGSTSAWAQAGPAQGPGALAAALSLSLELTLGLALPPGSMPETAARQSESVPPARATWRERALL